MSKNPVGKFSKYQRFQMEYQEPSSCRRMCKNRECRKMFTMIDKDQAGCSEECQEALSIKWDRLDYLRQWKQSN